MPENNFIEKITFNENFSPFKKDDEILFGGKEQVKKLIKFYLKDKEIKNSSGDIISPEDNAKRFKINCVLGNNGGGKSRLFEGFYDYNDSQFVSFNPKQDVIPKFKITKKLIFDKKIEAKNIILDDFYKISSNFDKSINFDFFNLKNQNGIYCNIYKFLDKNKKYFSTFLNINDNFKYKIEINFARNFTEESLYYFLNNDEINKEKNYLGDKKYEYFNVINYFYNYITGKTKTNLSTIIGKKDSLFLLLANLDLILLLVEELRGVVVEKHKGVINIERQGFKDFVQLFNIIEYLFNYIEENKIYNNLKYSGNTGWIIDLKKFSDLFKKYINRIKILVRCFDIYIDGKENEKIGKNKEANELFKKVDELYLQNFGKSKMGTRFQDFLYWETGYEYINHSGNHRNFLKEKIFIEDFEYLGVSDFIGDIKFIYVDKLVEKNYIFENIELANNEIQILSSSFFFDLDLELFDSIVNKKLNSLSAGELTNLIRLNNLYDRLISDNHTDNTILIDEPDLHLHLDWQKKYIQKLIDVFSTLDESIKLHFIIATHSPFIISDLPSECIIKLDGKGSDTNNTEFTKILTYDGIEHKNLEKIENNKNKSFGANFVDIINDGFFFKDKILMGSFAEENIKKLSGVYKTKILLDSYRIEENNFNENKDIVELMLRKINFIKEEEILDFENFLEIFNKLEEIIKIKENIGDDFLKENLLYL